MCNHCTHAHILQQWRLFPYLAAQFALLHFIYTFFTDFVTFSAAMVMGEQSERQVCVPPSLWYHTGQPLRNNS